MNMDLYITILESSVEHLNKLQNLLTAKNHIVNNIGMSKEGTNVETENIRMILLEIAETSTKIGNGAYSLLEGNKHE